MVIDCQQAWLRALIQIIVTLLILEKDWVSYYIILILIPMVMKILIATLMLLMLMKRMNVEEMHYTLL